MREQRACAGVAFVTFARPRQAADCIAELQAHSHTVRARARRYVNQGRHLAESVMESMASAPASSGLAKRLSGDRHRSSGRGSGSSFRSSAGFRSVDLRFMGHHVEAEAAPEPSDIQWADLAVRPPERFWRMVVSTAITTLLVVIGTAVIVWMTIWLGVLGGRDMMLDPTAARAAGGSASLGPPSLAPPASGFAPPPAPPCTASEPRASRPPRQTRPAPASGSAAQ